MLKLVQHDGPDGRAEAAAQDKGFTLVEVLVALVIAGLLGAIVMQGAQDVQMRARSVAQRDSAVVLARALAAQAGAGPFRGEVRTGQQGRLQWTTAESVVARDPRGMLLLARIAIEIRAGDRLLFRGAFRRLKPVTVQ